MRCSLSGHLCLGEEVEKILLGAVCFAGLGKELSVCTLTVSFQTVDKPMSACPHIHTIQLWASMERLEEPNLPLFSHGSSFLLCQQLRDLVQDTCKHLVGFPSAILGLATLRRQEVVCRICTVRWFPLPPLTEASESARCPEPHPDGTETYF